MSAGGQSAGGRRTAARLAAVQALYQMAITGAAAETVIEEFVAHRAGEDGDGSSLAAADRDLFADLVRGASARESEIERLIAPALAPGWTFARLETILQVILRAGAYELLARPDVPLEVVINEYVNLAHDFFAGREPAFVNGVLDRLARSLRAEEAEAAAHGGTAESR